VVVLATKMVWWVPMVQHTGLPLFIVSSAPQRVNTFLDLVDILAPYLDSGIHIKSNKLEFEIQTNNK
jgi:hypothetical protein